MPRADGGGALYVHIPFCDIRCPYCHFYCFVNRDPGLPERYVRALAREARAYSDELDRMAPLRSVYFGGGTPSALPPTAREWACAWLRDELGPRLAEDAEITLELNPESAWPESLEPWVEAGVNRLSIGIQSMDAETLRFLGRLNTPTSNRRVLELACGLVENVSVDFILATPGVRWEQTKAGLQECFAWPVAHVSAYLLEIHADTRFGRDVAAGRWSAKPDDDQADLYLRAVEWIGGRGLSHYELSNFARPGRESRHNRAYWQRVAYLGLGASAHSFAHDHRWWNHRDAHRYCEDLEADRRPVADEERLTPEQIRDERLMLGLRTHEGVERALLAGKEALWQSLAEVGLVEPAGERLRMTPRGWLVLDQVLDRLCRD